jgi:hypothetical protein
MPTNNAAVKVGITKILAESYGRSSIIIADNNIPQTTRANTNGLNEYFEEVAIIAVHHLLFIQAILLCY